MGCNCKTVKKINKRINANGDTYEKKGFMRLFSNLWVNFASVINMLGTCLLIIMLVPTVIVVLIYNFIFKKEGYVPLPSKFIHNRNSKLIEYEQE